MELYINNNSVEYYGLDNGVSIKSNKEEDELE